jgi:uridylate kinase
MKYKESFLKLSGEALIRNANTELTQKHFRNMQKKLSKIDKRNRTVINWWRKYFRGVAGASNGMDRVQGDYMECLPLL